MTSPHHPAKFRLLAETRLRPDLKVGDIVYDLMKYDYGLAGDDTRMTGVKHISVTTNPDGDYPSFTIPLKDVEQIEACQPAK